jgi:hypothetical protein
MRQSRPNSPRSPQSLQQREQAQQTRPSGLFGGRKTEHSFDFDGEGADDERTPLVGTVRTPRGTRHRRNQSDSIRSIDEYYGVRRRSRCGRLGGCLLGFCVLVAVLLSAVALLIMSNRPLSDVRIKKIENVLASEQEIMLDLLVGAVNPNTLTITIGDIGLDIFAKSKYVEPSTDYVGEGKGRVLTSSKTESTLRRRRRAEVEQSPAKTGNPNPWQDLSGHWHAPPGGVDKGTDPDEDLEKDSSTMLLGRISHFDQALAFEGSPVKRHPHYSLGELRLLKPGNKTETGGSARWQKVVQHPFELIVRGTLKYQLPISARQQSVSVGASVTVHPEDGVDEAGSMRIEPVRHEEHWQWIDWDEVVSEERKVGGKAGG